MNFGLCVITDENLAGGRDLPGIVSECLAGGADAVQLREKSLSTRVFMDLALEIKKRFSEYPGRLFIVNDRADIAIASGADGVHLGRDDMPVPFARKMMGPGAVIGVSVSNPDEAARAASEGADYLGAGAVFPTPTKPDSRAIGLEGLEKIAASVDIPVLAIGGIKKENVAAVIRAGARGIAVVSEVMSAQNPGAAVRGLLAAINSAA